ncbi:Ser/Thr protein phosphatase, putative [Trichomonas vaginalis G3]|uniref:Serine/threonine-protein phosphatase n=1 Tax=Trichomonas vaginalis (strain ATCC PRA-98 / G3) TaxID=412133 RepID=A2DIG4_TRIV3|nr:phosphoprotein phosphatase protein [Trichomonas vaginalis G3]EAY19768.1 Ser/Thr protein phosphatase, putative [Trichomonas vaginalis G3]KAI5523935.1 phosphoprotein phosphatase protein [Trichomonas vaginalis G3]|eukprot:XP_001580754.1 Ser/Thr protein phosphatase [Trichomonas vaginalis G3]
MLSRSIIDAYLPLIQNSSQHFDITKGDFEIPKLKRADLVDLLHKMIEIFRDEPSLIRLDGLFNVIGDIHGNLRDLLRVFAYCGTPIQNGYVFLGDYVDRGDFSIEVMVLLFSFKLAYPHHVYLLRGNHEFEMVNSFYGFRDQCINDYDEQIFNLFNEVFSYLPLAAIINDEYFLVHGGICPKLEKVSQIESIQRPIKTFHDEADDGDLITGLMWSDPSDSMAWFSDNIRGRGFFFGFQAARQFLDSNKLTYIIRAHECVDGLKEHFNGCVLTIFSSSHYYMNSNNSCGFIQLVKKSKYSMSMLPPMEQWKKMHAEYKFIEVGNTIPICQRSIKSFTTNRTRSSRLQYLIGSKNRIRTIIPIN